MDVRVTPDRRTFEQLIEDGAWRNGRATPNTILEKVSRYQLARKGLASPHGYVYKPATSPLGAKLQAALRSATPTR